MTGYPTAPTPADSMDDLSVDCRSWDPRFQEDCVFPSVMPSNGSSSGMTPILNGAIEPIHCRLIEALAVGTGSVLGQSPV